jgi:hypothetical protein
MTKTSLKAKYEPSAQAASATLSVGLGDLTLKASCSDRTLKDGYGLAGVSLGVEKPGLLIIDYDLPKQVTEASLLTPMAVRVPRRRKLVGQVSHTRAHTQRRGFFFHHCTQNKTHLMCSIMECVGEEASKKEMKSVIIIIFCLYKCGGGCDRLVFGRALKPAIHH